MSIRLLDGSRIDYVLGQIIWVGPGGTMRARRPPYGAEELLMGALREQQRQEKAKIKQLREALQNLITLWHDNPYPPLAWTEPWTTAMQRASNALEATDKRKDCDSKGKIRVTVSCVHEYDEDNTHWTDLFGGSETIGVLMQAAEYYRAKLAENLVDEVCQS